LIQFPARKQCRPDWHVLVGRHSTTHVSCRRRLVLTLDTHCVTRRSGDSSDGSRTGTAVMPSTIGQQRHA
jgi:hypothetical protein